MTSGQRSRMIISLSAALNSLSRFHGVRLPEQGAIVGEWTTRKLVFCFVNVTSGLLNNVHKACQERHGKAKPCPSTELGTTSDKLSKGFTGRAGVAPRPHGAIIRSPDKFVRL